jgi:hypothetical protein
LLFQGADFMDQPEPKRLKITPAMRYPRVAGIPGWVQMFFSYLLIAIPLWFLLDPLFHKLFQESGGTFLQSLIGGTIRSVVFSALFTIAMYRSASVCVAEDYVEGPFVGTRTQRILRANVSRVRVRENASRWALRPAGLLIWQRRPWPGKMILIPAGVAGYQQIKEQLLQWDPVDDRTA